MAQNIWGSASTNAVVCVAMHGCVGFVVTQGSTSDQSLRSNAKSVPQKADAPGLNKPLDAATEKESKGKKHQSDVI